MTDLPIRPIVPGEQYIVPVSRIEILTPLERIEARKRREEARRRHEERHPEEKQGEFAPGDRPSLVDRRA